MKDGKYVELTEKIIGCFYVAYSELGHGYSESVYASALAILFRQAGLAARREHVVDVLFQGERVGFYRLDFLVEDKVIVELKAGNELKEGGRAQLLSYLRSSKKEVGLLLHFGPDPVVKRVVMQSRSSAVPVRSVRCCSAVSVSARICVIRSLITCWSTSGVCRSLSTMYEFNRR